MKHEDICMVEYIEYVTKLRDMLSRFLEGTVALMWMAKNDQTGKVMANPADKPEPRNAQQAKHRKQYRPRIGKQRKAALLAEIAVGNKSIKQLATEYGISQQSVWNHKSRNKL